MSAPAIISSGTASGGPPVGGSGTPSPSTIPRWTGASTLGDSVITQSGTLIGVNKAIPTSTIDVDGLQTNSSGTSANTPTGTLRLNFAGQPTPGYGASIVFSQQWFAGSPTNYVAVGQITGVKTVAGGSFGGGVALWYNNGGNALVEGMRITDTGNVGIGTTSPVSALHVRNNTAGITLDSTLGGGRQYQLNPLRTGLSNSGFEIRDVTAGTGVLWFDATQQVGIGTPTPASRLDVAGTITCDDAGTGLKLPATPGNGNANTLDSYQEGTRVLSAGDLSGWTYVTATQYWTLVGRTVTLHTVFTGGTSSATGGATIATPPLLTPLRIAAGAAVNSSGTALGNGVCVVTSTSSTTGTVITSNAISSSAVDKVLTVTYETAGL